MSTLSCATIESRGTVGWRVNQSAPSRPISSAVCQTNSTDRFGRCPPFARYSAISSTDTLPLPSSSAPFSTESRRGWRSAPQAVEDRLHLRRLLRGGLARRAVGAFRPHEPVERAKRVVVLRDRGDAVVVVVRADRDHLAPERGIAAGEQRDHVPRRLAYRRILEAHRARHGLARGPRLHSRDRGAQQCLGRAGGAVHERRSLRPAFAARELRAGVLEIEPFGGADRVERRDQDARGAPEALRRLGSVHRGRGYPVHRGERDHDQLAGRLAPAGSDPGPRCLRTPTCAPSTDRVPLP